MTARKVSKRKLPRRAARARAKKKSLAFLGYRRPAGEPGARNLLVALSVMDNVNPLVRRIGAQFRDVTPITTTFGRNPMGEDAVWHKRVMGHLAGHPNVGASLFVSLEPESARAIAEVAAAASPWLPIEIVTIQETGGTLKSTARGLELAARLSGHLTKAKREPCGLGEITLGAECGGSDTTSGLISNPLSGIVADRVIDSGGTVLFSETLEIIGAEHLLAQRAGDAKTRRRLLSGVKRALAYAASMGVDLIGCNPTADNIAGGISSIEEKSLGAIKKAGSHTIVEVIGVGERPSQRGTVFVDAPCAAVENLTCLAACGAQAILFSTGGGNPIANPISPTLKFTGNPRTALHIPENIDLDLGGVMEGRMGFREAADALQAELVATLSGKPTAGEILGETEIAVSRAALNL